MKLDRLISNRLQLQNFTAGRDPQHLEPGEYCYTSTAEL